MSVQPIVLRPDQHEPALNVVGIQVTVLASNAAQCVLTRYLRNPVQLSRSAPFGSGFHLPRLCC
jgi:hypothetical protein